MENKIELIKITVWPVLIALFVIFNWSPIHKTIKQLPTIVTSSETITIGGLSLKINKSLQSRATNEVREVLQKISPEGIDLLLHVGNSHQVFTEQQYQEDGNERFKELIELGLVTKSGPTPGNEAYDVDIYLNRKGESVRRYIVEFISELIKETSN